MKNKLLLLLACCAMIVSCSKDGDGGGKKNTTKTYAAINHLSITDAQYLYTTTGTGGGGNARSLTRSSESDLAQLFKIIYNGQTETVSVQDANGEEIPVEEMKISYANDDLVFFAFYYGIYETDKDGNILYVPDDYDGDLVKNEVGGESQAYLIRKSDGAVFVVPGMFYFAFGWYRHSWTLTEEGFGQRPPEDYHNMRYDKNQNMYCAVGGGKTSIYKLTSGNGVTASKIAETANIDADFRVDWNGYVLYNDYDNTLCITPGGNSFHIENLQINPHNYFVTPFYDYADGGFLYWEWDNSELSLYKYTVNEATESGNKDLLETLPFSEWPSYGDGSLTVLSDKIVFNDHNTVIVVKNPGYIKVVNEQISNILHVSDNYIYWIDNNGIKSTDIDTEATTVFSFAANRDYYNYSFADDVILFYATDKQNRNIYLCQIKDGVYSDKLIQSGNGSGNDNGSSPEIIDFVRVN